MEKIYVIYWSMSGNTQAMAEAIAKGILEAVELLNKKREEYEYV